MVADNVICVESSSSPSSVTTEESSQNKMSIKEEILNGDYILVSVDIDTTGRRLIDEIVQLAAYTPFDHFEQYIMPYMNLNPAARQRHQIRVISIGFYRMLKSMQTYKIIKSKSEIAALKDFLSWLEKLKSQKSNCDGIVLLYHEERKFIPYMILESLKKYSLLDRFTNTVVSFTNNIYLAKSCINDTKQYSLNKLSKTLKIKEDLKALKSLVSSSIMDATGTTDTTTPTAAATGGASESKRLTNVIQFEREEFEGNASVRAKLVYRLASKLNSNNQPDSTDQSVNLLESLKPYLKPINRDILELDTQNENLERQNSFRPVFFNYFKTTLYHRVRAVKFRIILAEHGFNLHALNVIWTDKGITGLTEALEEIGNLKTEDRTELVELLDSYFDPNKMIIKPVVRANKNNNSNNNRRRNRRNNLTIRKAAAGETSSRSLSTEFGAGGDKSPMADSTTKSSPSPSKSGNRNGRGQRKRMRHSLNNTVTANITKTVEVLNKSSPAAV